MIIGNCESETRKIKLNGPAAGTLFLGCLAFLGIAVSASGGDAAQAVEGSAWTKLPNAAQAVRAGEPWIRPTRFQAVQLDFPRLGAELANAPKEDATVRQSAMEVLLPMPDATWQRFSIVESPIMEPGLAAKFPQIRTFVGRGIDDPAATLRADITPAGFHAQLLSPHGAVYIDPLNRGDVENYASYYKEDYQQGAKNFECLTKADRLQAPVLNLRAGSLATGDTLRSFRLAVAATGEYTQFHGGSVNAGMSAIVTAMNRVNGIYEQEVGVRMILVANNDLVVYTNASTDPYSNGNAGAMLGENQANLDSVIGFANYDVGHVFGVGSGGVAFLNAPCGSNKARGVTGTGSPVGDPFWVDFVAHEMGHQFGGHHTFNGQNGNCAGGNRTGFTAYEPGSGSTIMAYAGICTSNDNLQPNSDPFFHSESFVEIVNFVAGGGGSICAVTSPTGNQAPTVNAGPDFTIPAQTPFVLTAESAGDPDGNSITYQWEERDLGPPQTANSMVDNGFSPLFRSFEPTLGPSRTLPRMSDLLSNVTTIGEVMPSTTRILRFRLTIRDNQLGGGGVTSDDIQVDVEGSAGPFRITTPNEPQNFAGGVEVTWDVAGTDLPPINVTVVNILLSTDGGNSFAHVLSANTPNDGNEFVSFPEITTNSARIKIEAVGNIFFDISNANFVVDTFATPLAVGPPHDVRKNRYVSFNPNNSAASTAILVELLDLACSDTGVTCFVASECRACVAGSNPGVGCFAQSDCFGGGVCQNSSELCSQASAPVFLGWVGEPRDPSCQILDTGDPLPDSPACEGQDVVSRVVPDPVFRVWNELLVHVADCEIAPVQTYRFRASPDGAVFSSGLDLPTIRRPGLRSWGDMVGAFIGGEWSKPDGIVNVNDVQAQLFFILQKNASHATRFDLGRESPNFLVNATDLQLVIKAFLLRPYPPIAFGNQGDPSGCP